MFRSKFPINSFGLIPQSNTSPKIFSLTFLIFSKFISTSHLNGFIAIYPIVFFVMIVRLHICLLLCAIRLLETTFSPICHMFCICLKARCGGRFDSGAYAGGDDIVHLGSCKDGSRRGLEWALA